MKRNRFLPFLFCLAFTACPYQSPVPLDSPERGAIDQKLLGSWAMHDESPGSFGEVEFVAFNEHEYYVEVRSHEPYKPVETSRYRLYSTTVAGRALLNCRDITSGKKEEGWFIASYELKGEGAVNFMFVNDDAMKKAQKADTSKALRAYVEKHMEDKDFFEPGFILTRHGRPPEGEKDKEKHVGPQTKAP